MDGIDFDGIFEGINIRLAGPVFVDKPLDRMEPTEKAETLEFWDTLSRQVYFWLKDPAAREGLKAAAIAVQEQGIVESAIAVAAELGEDPDALLAEFAEVRKQDEEAINEYFDRLKGRLEAHRHGDANAA